MFTLGSASRNPVRGPGYKNVDLAISRRIPMPMRGGTALEVRAEAFNLFNTPPFANPGATLGTATFGSSPPPAIRASCSWRRSSCSESIARSLGATVRVGISRRPRPPVPYGVTTHLPVPSLPIAVRQLMIAARVVNVRDGDEIDVVSSI